MSKTQILRESKKIRLLEKGKKRQTRIRAVILSGSIAPEQNLIHLSDAERETLRNQVKIALIKERRRANARAWTYDMGRHVSLYLLAKSLQTKNEAGPVSKPR